MILAGVLRDSSMRPFRYNPALPSRMLTKRKVIRAVEMEVFIFPCCLAPRYWEVKTDAPFPPPMAIMINTLVRA